MTAFSPVVLLVEHDIIVRHPLAEYLRECGFTVFEASNGDDSDVRRRYPQARSCRKHVALSK
jgi:DNA-binding response OmpR family regulator